MATALESAPSPTTTPHCNSATNEHWDQLHVTLRQRPMAHSDTTLQLCHSGAGHSVIQPEIILHNSCSPIAHSDTTLQLCRLGAGQSVTRPDIISCNSCSPIAQSDTALHDCHERALGSAKRHSSPKSYHLRNSCYTTAAAPWPTATPHCNSAIQSCFF